MKQYTTPDICLMMLESDDVISTSGLLNGGTNGVGMNGIYDEFEAL